MENEKAIALKRGRYIAQKRKLLRMASGHVAGLLGVSNATYSKCERTLSDAALEKYGDDLAAILCVSKEDISMGGSSEGYSANDERHTELGDLGARAKARREALGKTRLKVCEKLNVHSQTLGLWEERLPKRRKDDVEVPWEQELQVPMGWLRDMSMQAPEVAGMESKNVDLSQVVDSISAECKNVSEEIEAIGAWLCRRQPYKRTAHHSKLNERERTTVEMFSRRYGVYGDEASTLQVIGDHFKLTRERVRQIIQKMVERASNLPIETPHLLTLKERVEGAKAISVEELEMQCRDLLGPHLSLESADRFARELNGLQIACIRRFGGPALGKAFREMVGSDEDIELVRHVRECSMRMIRRAGGAHVLYVTGMVSQRMERAVSSDEVKNALPVVEDFSWLSDDQDWYWFGERGTNNALENVRMMLSVAQQRMDVEDIHQGLCRSRRRIYEEDRTMPPNIEMPQSVLKVLLRRVSWLKTLQHDDFVLNETVNYESLVSDSERDVISAIGKLGGIASRQRLKQEVVETGKMSEPALSLVLASSPVIKNTGDGMFYVRGKPFTVEALQVARQQFGLKPRDEARVDDRGRLEFDLRMSTQGLANAVLDFPAHISRVLPKGEYQVTGACAGTALLGTVPTAPTRVTRLARVLKMHGVTADEVITLLVDPDKREIQVKRATVSD